MGRELKRVPLDFDWPVNKVWKGFINPHYEKCKVCDGQGVTVAYSRLADLVSLLMLSGSDSLEAKCHPYFHRAPLFYTQGKTCGADMAELTGALAGRMPRTSFGHDACDTWAATKKILEAAGVSKDWGNCPHCVDGITKDKYELYESWERTEPPSGEGYQIWETVSEGSPISPVFATPEELAQHMARTAWGADKGTSYEQWLKFITGPGYAPSMLMDSQGCRTGVQAC